MSQALTFIPPIFEPMERGSVTDIAGKEKKKNTRWAGAVDINSEDNDDPFIAVEGSWIVSRPYPPTASWTADGWKNGRVKAGTWVGIDGYHTKDKARLLQGGTGQRCIVTSQYQTIEQTTRAWVEWTPDEPHWFSNFEVRPGDLVTTIVESVNPKKGKIMIFNRSASTYSIAYLKMPEEGLPIKGLTAEWIVEGSDVDDPVWGTSFLGATFIFDCWATTESLDDKDLSNAKLVNMLRDGQPYIEAKKENNNLVGLFDTTTRATYTKVDSIDK